MIRNGEEQVEKTMKRSLNRLVSGKTVAVGWAFSICYFGRYHLTTQLPCMAMVLLQDLHEGAWYRPTPHPSDVPADRAIVRLPLCLPTSEAKTARQ
jgi:hypothetical protein